MPLTLQCRPEAGLPTPFPASLPSLAPQGPPLRSPARQWEPSCCLGQGSSGDPLWASSARPLPPCPEPQCGAGRGWTGAGQPLSHLEIGLGVPLRRCVPRGCGMTLGTWSVGTGDLGSGAASPMWEWAVELGECLGRGPRERQQPAGLQGDPPLPGNGHAVRPESFPEGQGLAAPGQDQVPGAILGALAPEDSSRPGVGGRCRSAPGGLLGSIAAGAVLLQLKALVANLLHNERLAGLWGALGSPWP